jgi:hypothetical protein
MSIYETSITNTKKQLDFYKQLSEQLQQENKQLQEELKYTIGIVEHNRIISEKNKKIHQLKDNWNKLKEYLINDLNDRNGHRVAEYEDGNKVSETISPIYTLMEDKSKTMKEVLDKMQELEQGSDSK